jgi:hypothetical protein
LRWTGFDEGDDVSSDGTAELHEEDTIEIELSFDAGDDVVLKARRDELFSSLVDRRPNELRRW